MKVKEIEVSKIESVENIRSKIDLDVSELMSSIKSYGLLQPIGLFGTGVSGYVIVWGNRRLTACKKLGWKTIPGVILDSEELSENDFILHHIVENEQRIPLSPFELGRGVYTLS